MQIRFDETPSSALLLYLMFYYIKARLSNTEYKKKPQRWKGEHVYVSQGVYTHHGVLDGEGTVIHYAKDGNGKKEVQRTSFKAFLGKNKVAMVVRHPISTRNTKGEAVAHAEQFIGKKGYNLAFNNCEHFATECVQGFGESRQSDRWIGGVVGGTKGMIRDTFGLMFG